MAGKWEWVKLEEIIAAKLGSVDPSKFPNEVFDLYSIPAFDKGQYEVLQGSEIGSEKQLVQENDVMLSKIVPHIRRAWIVGKNNQQRMIASGEWIVFRSNRFHPEYLRHVVTSDFFHTQFMATVAGVGGSLLRARPVQVSQIKIPLPPIEEQKRIAAILDSADAIRTKRKAAIAKLDELVQSIFLDMFGDPVKNEKGWLIKEFDEVCESRLGKMLDGKKQLELSQYKYLRNSNVQWFNINQDDIAEIGLNDSEKTILALHKGDILMCEGGEPGRCAIWDSQEEMYYQKALHRIRFRDKQLDQQYFIFLFWFLAHRNGLKDYISVSTIAHLPGEKLKKMKIPVPPYELQKDFKTKIDKVNRLKKLTQSAVTTDEQAFSSLQQRAFSGELLI